MKERSRKNIAENITKQRIDLKNEKIITWEHWYENHDKMNMKKERDIVVKNI